MVERVPTGIPGLDSLIQGGFPKGRTILVAGPTGAGKSILGMQFLYKGIMEYGEPGVFFTLDEPANQLREDLAVFGWNLEDLENSGKLILLEGAAAKAGFTTEEKYAVTNMSLSVDYLLHDIRKACSTIGAKRFVLDSIPALSFQSDNPSEIRKAILRISLFLKKLGLTSILTTEIPEMSVKTEYPKKYSKYDVEEYIADGLIVLNFVDLGIGEPVRSLCIKKMRGTYHTTKLFQLSIDSKGASVIPLEG